MVNISNSRPIKSTFKQLWFQTQVVILTNTIVMDVRKPMFLIGSKNCGVVSGNTNGRCKPNSKLRCSSLYTGFLGRWHTRSSHLHDLCCVNRAAINSYFIFTLIYIISFTLLVTWNHAHVRLVTREVKGQLDGVTSRVECGCSSSVSQSCDGQSHDRMSLTIKIKWSEKYT